MAVTDESYGVSIRVAAERLGISEGAIRQRIRRRTLDTQRLNGRTYVLLPPSRDDRHEPSYTGVPSAVTPNPEQQLELIRDTLLMPLIQQNQQAQATIAEQATTIGRLEERVTTLRQHIEQLEDEQRSPRFARITVDERQALEARMQTLEDQHTRPSPSQRSWWRFWGRS